MASVSSSLLAVILCVFFTCAIASQPPTVCPIESIYQFGDSLADTGNLIRIAGATSRSFDLPYGETYFHKPTGRCSDGKLIVDYIATALKLPFLNPYLDRNASFDHGVNFAVSGSTALDISFFAARNISIKPWYKPLSVQLQWFRSHLNSTCNSPPECAKKLEKALFLVGEIGGNDYNHAFFQRTPIKEIRSFVPHVVASIADAVREVIRLGAKRVVVPGPFPFGCMPSYLSTFHSNNSDAYNRMGCLKELNQLSSSHDYNLQRALAIVRSEFPHVVINYGDYYGAFESLLRRGSALGFEHGALLKACCGIGGPYNFDSTKMCGSPGVPACENPAQKIHWDGIHLTQEAYHHISKVIIRSITNTMCTG